MFKYLKSTKGVTLIEIMTVVVIVGILAAAASPEFERAIEKIKFKSTTKSAISMMRLARSNAISEKTPYGVYFDYDTRSFTLFRDDSDPASYSFDASGDLILSADTVGGQYGYVWASFTNSAIVFEPNGTASESGYIYMGSYTDNTSQHSGLSVLASTGRAKVDYITLY